MPESAAPTWGPTEHDYHTVLLEQNPWFSRDDVPAAWNLAARRPLAMRLWTRLLHDDPRRFQVVIGPRRVGKTTALYQTVQQLLDHGVPPQRLAWLRLDHPLLMRRSLGDMVRGMLSDIRVTPDEPLFLFLDELEYATDFDLWLKTFYDEAWPVRVAASSSSAMVLRQRHFESGVGRWDEQYLAPYLFSEYLPLVGHARSLPVADTFAETLHENIAAPVDLLGLDLLRRRFLLTGGFPELLVSEAGAHEDDATALLNSQRTLRSDAVERAIYKDIPHAFGIDNPLLLERMLYTLGGQMCGVLSPAALCQAIGGLTQPTFDKYLAYLERAFLVFTLPNYSGNDGSIQRRGRKLYFVDGAVRNAALQRGLSPLDAPGEMGLLTENMIAGHLHALAQQMRVRLYHWRDGSHEVDMIYDHPTHPVAFEISSSDAHHRRGLRRLCAQYPRFAGRCYVVMHRAKARRPSEDREGIGTLPLDLLLLAAGAQADAAMGRQMAPRGGVR
jgi:hypothetical protein